MYNARDGCRLEDSFVIDLHSKEGGGGNHMNVKKRCSHKKCTESLHVVRKVNMFTEFILI